MAPVLGLNDRPAGRPGLTANVSGPVPPEPVTGVNGVAAALTVNNVLGITWLTTTVPVTARLNVLVAVAAFASVTVTVNVAAADVDVGVPDMVPVLVLNDRPAGSVPVRA